MWLTFARRRFLNKGLKFCFTSLECVGDNGLTIIGQHEHDEQVEKHGSRRQIMQLAKSLMRVATVMGLGSNGANGQFLPDELEGSTCDIGSRPRPV